MPPSSDPRRSRTSPLLPTDQAATCQGGQSARRRRRTVGSDTASPTSATGSPHTSDRGPAGTGRPRTSDSHPATGHPTPQAAPQQDVGNGSETSPAVPSQVPPSPRNHRVIPGRNVQEEHRHIKHERAVCRPGHREAAHLGSSTRVKRFGRRCREPVTGSVPAVNATRMGRTSTEEKHDG